MSTSWDERVDGFWADADDVQPDHLWIALEPLLAERGHGDAAVLFERASLHDYLGEEADAVPLYRAALDADLAEPRRGQAVIQLASSLRNIGDPSGAMAVLRAIPAEHPLADAAQAFLALALFDDEKPAPALRTAVRALAPHLIEYRAAVERYADALIAPERIRHVVVGLLVRDGYVLAERYPDNGRHDGFLRAPGGGVVFGERADSAIRREFAEELGAQLDQATLLTVLENIYDAAGKRGHEIVYVYAIRCAQLEELPQDARLDVLDSDTTVGWYEIERLRRGDIPFYPAGILDVVDAAGDAVGETDRQRSTLDG